MAQISGTIKNSSGTAIATELLVTQITAAASGTTVTQPDVYHVLSSPDGKFSINVPAGTYRVSTKHGSAMTEISVPGGSGEYTVAGLTASNSTTISGTLTGIGYGTGSTTLYGVTGTNNKVVKWKASSPYLVDSSITDDGTTVTVGATLAVSMLSTGSVLFSGASGAISQDNSNLFFNDSTNCLGVGTNAPTARLEGVSRSAGVLSLIADGETNSWAGAFLVNGITKAALRGGTSGADFALYDGYNVTWYSDQGTTVKARVTGSTGTFRLGKDVWHVDSDSNNKFYFETGGKTYIRGDGITLRNQSDSDIVVINSSGVITTGAWNATVIGAIYGGTAQSSWTTGDMLYSSATNTLAKLAVGSAGKIIRSTGTIPAWSTSTFADTYTANNILYASSANTVAGLATANSAVLVTNGSGVPSLATDIPTAVTIGGAYVYRVSGTDVAIADGGTGASTATAGFDNLSPTTTRGDLIYRGASNNVRLAVGSSGQYVRSNGTDPTWSAILAGDLPGSFSGFANPTASVGLSAVNGSATTAMRSDAAPALSQSIAPTWTATHAWSGASSLTGMVEFKVSGDAANRLGILAGGTLLWADGTASGDTNLYRSAANELKTDDALVITGALTNSNLTASKVVFTDANKVLTSTGTVAVDQGGTGATTLASNGVLYGNGTSAIQALAVNSTGTTKFLTQVSSGAPSWYDLFTTQMNLNAVFICNPSTTPTEAVNLSIASLSSAGQRDSHRLKWIGQAYDTGAHSADWIAWVDVVDNAGASYFTLQSRIDAASYANRFRVDDGGNIITGVWASNTIGSGRGGTGQSTVVTGDLLYGAAANTWGRLAIGSSANYLRSDGTNPAWSAILAGDLPSTITGAAYVTIGNDATLSAERALTGTANQITITDNGANNTVVLSLPQSIHTGATTTFQKQILSGLTLNTDATGAIATLDGAFSVTKNDANTRTFHGIQLKPTLNTGASNTNTTLNLFTLDTTNTATTGLTVNLLNVLYGGAERLKLGSGGTLYVSGSLGVGDTAPPWQLTVTAAGAVDIAARDTSTGVNAIVTCISSQAWFKTNGTLIFGAGSGYAERARIDTSGRLGIGVTPTATLHLKAGSTAANSAPCKYNSGSLMTTAEAGAQEYDGKAYWDTTDQLMRLSRVYTGFTATNTTTVQGTVTETSIIGTGVGSLTVKGNYPAVGKVCRITMSGTYTMDQSGASFTLRIKLGSVTLTTITVAAAFEATAATQGWRLHYDYCYRAIGASGSVFANGAVLTGESATAFKAFCTESAGLTTVDTTADATLDVTIQNSNASNDTLWRRSFTSIEWLH